MAEPINIRFISEVKKRPCLYNYSLKEYSKKEITEKAWSEVGKTVRLTALQAKDKWKNLRSVFVRNLKATQNGSSKRKKYYLTDAMEFARPFIKLSGTIPGSLPNIEQNDEIETVVNNDTQETYQNPLPASPSQSDLSFTEDPSINVSLKTCSLRSPSPQSVSSQRTGHTKKLNEIDECFKKYLKYKMKQNNDSTSNANRMFLLSLLPDLNMMTPTQMRSFKRQVMCFMENILNETTNTSSSQNMFSS